ncbi:MAG: DUF86 domain-containing protein [Deltaproteobacteria bacterium]|nr:DUF86 domain-containing protein [Deltaproteobacteria bacterium]
MSPSREARRRAGQDALADIGRYRQTVPLARLLADRDEQRKVLHALLVAVQACVDEALAECRARGLSGGSTYRGAFEALGQAGAIPAQWLPGLLEWASFRNVLAHFYPVLDLRRVHGALSETEVLERFLAWCSRDTPT